MFYSVLTPNGVVIVYAENPNAAKCVAAEEACCAAADCHATAIDAEEYGVVVSYVTRTLTRP